MSKYKMLCDVRDADGELVHAEGDTVDLSGAEAKRWETRRLVEKVAPAKKAAAKKGGD